MCSCKLANNLCQTTKQPNFLTTRVALVASQAVHELCWLAGWLVAKPRNLPKQKYTCWPCNNFLRLQPTWHLITP